jgi:predicted metal-binding protein
MLSQSGLEKFDFLRKLVSEMGTADAKAILTGKVIVEDRIVLKCKVS